MVYDKVIQGQYVNIRSITVDDAEITLKMRLDKKKTKFLHQVENNIGKQAVWIEQQMRKENDYCFVAEDKSGNVIGMTGLYEINNKKGHAGRLLMYGNPFQSVEAYLLMLKFGFNILGLEVIYGDNDIKNTASMRFCSLFGYEFKDPIYDEELDRYVSICTLTKQNLEKNMTNINSMIYR